MKNNCFLLVAAMVLWGGLEESALAQILVRERFEHNAFLSYAPVSLEVSITNNFGREITLTDSAGQGWLTVDIMDSEGRPIANREAALKLADLKIPSGGTMSRSFDLQQYFYIHKPGRYRIQAIIGYEGQGYASVKKEISIEQGQSFWEKKAAMVVPNEGAKINDPSQPPATHEEVRRYELLRYNSGDGIDLYLRISDDTGNMVYRCFSLGTTVDNDTPEIILGKSGELHILHRAAPKIYFYSRISLSGNPEIREIYTIVNTVPQLARDTKGSIGVIGGEKYANPLPSERQ